MKASYKKYVLNFKRPSGTSRGVLTTKETWFLILEENTKEITLTEITQTVIPYVISNSDQTPEFAPIHKSGHDGGDFIFVPKN